MIVVSNTTPLIGLSSINRFELLRQVFGTIHIPQEVYAEAVIRGREQGEAKREIPTANWIKVHQVENKLAVTRLSVDLDLGKAETIVLAQQLKADWVLMDERKGRPKLARLNMPKIGTLGLLLEVKKLGLISVIQPDIEKLRRNDFSLSHQVVTSVLKKAGE